ncbi:MAG: tetratricopeptide repeat protein, partial [Burkholderiales bacterium]
MNSMKIGRNDPCSCGSGKKYKLCCGGSQGIALAPRSSVDETLRLAIEHHQAGRLPIADSLYRQVLLSHPDHAEANFFSGMLARHMGDLDLAENRFTKALQTNPRYAAAAVSLGNVHLARGHLDAAEKNYRIAIAVDGSILEAHVHLGNVLQSRGHTDQALSSYRRALEVNPNSAEILGNLGNALQATGEFNEAIACYDQALAIRPNSAELLSNLGISLNSNGNADQAIERLNQSTSIKPDYGPAHYNLAIALQSKGNIESAITSYRRALDFLPNNARIHAKLASALRAHGKPLEAVARYRQAIALEPDLVAAHNELTALLATMVPLWHVPMMNDALRNNAYFEALKAAITPDSHVLEIGTGSGLLSMMAAKLNAKSVTTCEAEPIVAAAAKRIIAENGLGERINAIAKVSNDLKIGVDIGVPADILVSEVLSSELLGEHVLPSIEDAKRRLLKPGGRIIPAEGSIKIALIGGAAIGANLHVSKVHGFDLGHFNSIVQRKQGITRNDLDIEFFTDDVEAFHFDFQNVAFHPGESKLLRIPVKTTGLCFGIIQWIRLQMDANTVFENHPSIKAAASGWQHLAYVFPAPVELKADQIVKVAAVHDRLFPWFSLEGI